MTAVATTAGTVGPYWTQPNLTDGCINWKSMVMYKTNKCLNQLEKENQALWMEANIKPGYGSEICTLVKQDKGPDYYTQTRCDQDEAELNMYRDKDCKISIGGNNSIKLQFKYGDSGCATFNGKEFFNLRQNGWTYPDATAKDPTKPPATDSFKTDPYSSKDTTKDPYGKPADDPYGKPADDPYKFDSSYGSPYGTTNGYDMYGSSSYGGYDVYGQSSKGAYDMYGSYGNSTAYASYGAGGYDIYGTNGKDTAYGSYGSYGDMYGSYGGNYASYGSSGDIYGSSGENYASYGQKGDIYGSYGGNYASYGQNGDMYGSYGGNYGSYGAGGYDMYGSFEGNYASYGPNGYDMYGSVAGTDVYGSYNSYGINANVNSDIAKGSAEYGQKGNTLAVEGDGYGVKVSMNQSSETGQQLTSEMKFDKYFLYGIDNMGGSGNGAPQCGMSNPKEDPCKELVGSSKSCCAHIVMTDRGSGTQQSMYRCMNERIVDMSFSMEIDGMSLAMGCSNSNAKYLAGAAVASIATIASFTLF